MKKTIGMAALVIMLGAAAWGQLVPPVTRAPGDFAVGNDLTVVGTIYGDGSGLTDVTAKLVPIYDDAALIASGATDTNVVDLTTINGAYALDLEGSPGFGDIYIHATDSHLILQDPDTDAEWSWYYFNGAVYDYIWFNTNASPWLGDWEIYLLDEANFGGIDLVPLPPTMQRIEVSGLEGDFAKYNGVYEYGEGGGVFATTQWSREVETDVWGEINLFGNGATGYMLSARDVTNPEAHVVTLLYHNTNVTFVAGGTVTTWPWDGAWSSDNITIVDEPLEELEFHGEGTPTVANAFVNTPTLIRDFAEGGQYLPRSGLLPMTGDLDMGGNSITNVKVDSIEFVGGEQITMATYTDTVAKASSAVQGTPWTGEGYLTGVAWGDISGTLADQDDLTNTVEKASSALQDGDTATLNARTLFSVAEIAATSADGDPESIRGAIFVDMGSEAFNDAPVWWDTSNEWVLWYNADSNKWWISASVGSEGAGWEGDDMVGEFTALDATGTVTLDAMGIRFSQLNYYLISLEEKVNEFKAPEGDRPVPGATTVGTIRYREDGDESFLEVIMQTGESSWEWVVIETRNWEAEE